MALKIGTQEEEGGYGWQATGVKSYGDMSANYKGFTFWSNLYDQPNPYFACENNKWKQLRKFDWRDYVDDSLDESINCNEFRTIEMNKKMDDEVAKRWSAAGLNETTCPASTESCKYLAKNIHNKKVLSSILHPRCAGALNQIPQNNNAAPSIKNQNSAGGVR